MILELEQEVRNSFFELLAFPERGLLLSLLRKFKYRDDIYVVGGAVRDLFFGRRIYDLDLAVKHDPQKFQLFLAERLKYTPVPLSQEFGIYRLAKGNLTIDICLYRGETIEEDLRNRDFTINSLAIPIRSLFEGPVILVDPTCGLRDLKYGIIRSFSRKNILDDPLRILRAYRFFSQGYGTIDSSTREIFAELWSQIQEVAGERINLELKQILLSCRAYEAFCLMAEDGVLYSLIPELAKCRGIKQPSFHHLDVLNHLLEAMGFAEKILLNPRGYLPLEELPREFEDEDFIQVVKLASLLHDLGKGYTYAIDEDRITFYGHEKVGAELWEERAKVLRFKSEIIERVSRLIRNHMRPCHLLKEWEEGRLTLRAKRNLLKDQPSLYELWIVALADSLASKGPDKEPDYEERLNAFFLELLKFQGEMLRIEKKERLITGKDLINLGFVPGPLFRVILEEIEIQVLEGKLKTKEEAIKFILSKYGNQRQGKEGNQSVCRA